MWIATTDGDIKLFIVEFTCNFRGPLSLVELLEYWKFVVISIKSLHSFVKVHIDQFQLVPFG